MDSIILIGSIIGIVNSFILIIYALTTKKGNRTTNLVFSFLIFMLTLRIAKSVILAFLYELHDFLITLGLAGFFAIGPSFYLFSESIIRSEFKLKRNHLLHFLPAMLLLVLWFFIDDLRNNNNVWHLFYRLILLQYIIYITNTIFKVNFSSFNRIDIIRQINLIGYFLSAIWFLYLLNEVSGFPYISGAILYSILVYFSLVIILNKGFIINNTNPKYKNTGLKKNEETRVFDKIESLLNIEKIYKSNTISLNQLAKKTNSNPHNLSQVINVCYGKSFFELLAEKRIQEAKFLLKNNKSMKIRDIAFEVGYNSLSAFNSAFKKMSGITPSTFRNEK